MTENATAMKLVSEDTETVVEVSGETGGPDLNLGREFSKRFTWETGNPEEPYVSITTTTYVQGRDANGEDVEVSELENKKKELTAWEERYAEARRDLYGREMHQWLDENPAPLRFVWSEQTEFIVHTDLEDLGGTEVRSDYEYGEGSYTFFSSIESAEESAKTAADRLSADQFGPEHV